MGKGALLEDGRIAGRIEIVDGAGEPRAEVDLAARDAILKGAKLAIGASRVTAAGPMSKLPYKVDAKGVFSGGRWQVAGGGVPGVARSGLRPDLRRRGLGGAT